VCEIIPGLFFHPFGFADVFFSHLYLSSLVDAANLMTCIHDTLLNRLNCEGNALGCSGFDR